MNSVAQLRLKRIEPLDEEQFTAPVEMREAALGLPVTLNKVSKRFGGRGVLNALSLSIEASEFVAVVGRSGCGKTTLLRLITGLGPVSDGHLTIAGAEVRGLQERVRLLFQDARLLMWQRVLNNVGISREAGWRETAKQALQDVGLADRAQDWPAVLSGGQKQRVALARALVSRPGVLLLDEPFGALDALTRAEMHELLLRIWDAHRFTTILITHDVAEAVTLADRIVVLRDGNVALDQKVDLPRHRRSGAEAARLQNIVLGHV
jgi:sulfonate transport system ATP-binding protein